MKALGHTRSVASTKVLFSGNRAPRVGVNPNLSLFYHSTIILLSLAYRSESNLKAKPKTIQLTSTFVTQNQDKTAPFLAIV
jgi:hypothetical protein